MHYCIGFGIVGSVMGHTLQVYVLQYAWRVGMDSRGCRGHSIGRRVTQPLGGGWGGVFARSLSKAANGVGFLDVTPLEYVGS